MEYNRNFFIAIGLSLLIILAWQFFYVAPKNADQQKAQEIARQLEQNQPSQGQAVPSADNGSTTPPQSKEAENVAAIDMTREAREAAINKSKRVEIDTTDSGDIGL